MISYYLFKPLKENTKPNDILPLRFFANFGNLVIYQRSRKSSKPNSFLYIPPNNLLSPIYIARMLPILILLMLELLGLSMKISRKLY